ncbi:mandelate racemase/muconate lactonizing enzyme family protein [Chelativorans sp. Marseille-P2723]|uniref:mandelate racemase/muconate lactonizing enzyme family protein n=1 Tax=Chelativorans sp. Marseille-P2723 TaxID=2709133 RepID=UPI0015705FEA|nr:mandelate racemase/muconate lactonizing enzyme family protein [Chelativorans sp. Marseille-P2723]
MNDTIRHVEPFLIDSGGPKAWLFVRMESSSGHVGWGEAYTVTGREAAVLALIKELGRQIIGRGIHTIRDFKRTAFLDFAIKRGSLEFHCAVSAIEIAMWDIVGKRVGQPVYNLLGGACQSSFKVYANGWLRKFDGSTQAIEAGARKAAELIEAGFRALKFDPFPGPWRPFISRGDRQAAKECVRSIREAVGPDVELLIEAHRRFTTASAISVARDIAPFDPYWLEEPVPSSHPEGLAEVRRACGIPVVSGEDLYSKSAFNPLFAARAVDIINPDVTNCGGILELTEIAAMADACLVAVSPHNYNSPTVGLAATIQACATMPNFLITEYFVNFAERASTIVKEPLLLKDGSVSLPSAPGIGLELDEAALRQYQIS